MTDAPPSPARAWLVEDEPHYRNVFEFLIGQTAGIQLTASFGTAEAAIAEAGEVGSADSGLAAVEAFIARFKAEEERETAVRNSMTPTPTLLPDLKFAQLVFGQDLGSGAFSTVKFAKKIIS